MYIWVDSDFAIARGLHQGYPKKLGSIHMTRPHPYGPAPRVAPGGQFGASLAAADRRLAEARITLLEESPANGFVNAHPMTHNRFVRAIDDPSAFRLDEIIATGSAGAEGGPAFRARVERFSLPGDYIAGYTVANDFGLHDFRDTDAGSMLRVKGSDTLCPLGPGLSMTGTSGARRCGPWSTARSGRGPAHRERRGAVDRAMGGDWPKRRKP